MTLYVLLRSIHLSCVGLTFVSFTTRGLWMWFSPERLERPWVRITPHVIDTLLLASAIGLAITIRQYPFVNGWLTAKLIGLLIYIGLGMIALHHGRSLMIRLAAFLAALLVFGYIVLVARAHYPWPW